MSEPTQSWAQWQTWDAIQASLDAADRMLHKAILGNSNIGRNLPILLRSKKSGADGIGAMD